jgi:CRP/FNR family transcriptional regulator
MSYSLEYANCADCIPRAHCLAAGLDRADSEKLSQLITHSPPLKKGQLLYYQGDKFQAIYAVQAGIIKTYRLVEGEEHIINFYFPGELIGLSCIHRSSYNHFAVALTTASVCCFPYQQLTELAGQLPPLRQRLLVMMSSEIDGEQQMVELLSKKQAQQRLALFLLNVSRRLQARGQLASSFRLAMSRQDIGNYLGLALETVSRVFSQLAKQQLIAVQGKEVTLLKRDRLQQLINSDPSHSDK